MNCIEMDRFLVRQEGFMMNYARKAITQELADEGLVFRTFAGKEDIEKMIMVHSACREVDDLVVVLQEKDVALEIQHPKNTDPTRDWIIVEVNGEMAAYSKVFWRKEEPSKNRVHHIHIYVHPKWRELGIHLMLLQYNEARHRQIATDLPQDGLQFYQVQCQQEDKAVIRLYQDQGYQPVRYLFDMVRPDLENIPDLPLPEGVEVRTVKPEHFREVWKTDIESFSELLASVSWHIGAIQYSNGRGLPEVVGVANTLHLNFGKLAWHEDRVSRRAST